MKPVQYLFFVLLSLFSPSNFASGQAGARSFVPLDYSVRYVQPEWEEGSVQEGKPSGEHDGQTLSTARSLRVESPVGENLDRQVIIALQEATSGVMISVNKVYSICRGEQCSEAQRVQIWGLNKGEKVYPMFLFNPGCEDKITIIGRGTLEIRTGMIDDFLVFFEEPVSEVVVLNGKKVPEHAFSVYLEIDQIGVVERLAPDPKTLRGVLLCELEQLDIFLDNSSSMTREKRKQAQDHLTRLLEVLRKKNAGLTLGMHVVFSQDAEVTSNLFSIQNRDEIEAFLRSWTQGGSFSQGNCSDWSVIQPILGNQAHSTALLVTDGMPNGIEGRKTLLAHSFGQFLEIEETCVVLNVSQSLSDQQESGFPWYFPTQFLEDISYFEQVNCSPTTSFSELVLFPNPTAGSFQIQLSGEISQESVYKLVISTGAGQVVHTQAVLATRERQAINLDFLPKGIFFLSVYENGRLIGTDRISIL